MEETRPLDQVLTDDQTIEEATDYLMVEIEMFLQHRNWLDGWQYYLRGC